MGDFFRGWRRKVGCITLMMACAFAAGWVRSKSRQDDVRISVGYLPLFFNSCNGQLTWWQLQYLETVPTYSFVFDWQTNPETRGRIFSFSKVVVPKKGRSSGPVHVRIPRAELLEQALLVNWTADYWTFTIPLTFISAWLLLSKPRKSLPKKSVEPIPDEGT